MFCARPLSLVLLAAAIGCGEDQEAPLGNPNPTPTLAPIPGGGTAGGAINGAFTLFLIDSTDRPVEGAQIRVEVGNTTLEGTTNAAGRADFEVAEGPVAVHAFKANYAYSSALGLGSRALTLELEDTGSTAAIGTVTGTVSGWDLLPALEQNKARVAVVSALGDDLAAVPQDPRPGTVTANDPEGSDSNVCLLGLPPFPRQRDYGLKLEVRAQALFVLGGSFSFAESPPVTLTHVGIRTALDVQEGQSRSGHDVALTHALDQPLEIMSSAPRPVGFDEGMATFALQLGDAGPFAPLAVSPLNGGRGTSRGPTLDRDFAEASYLAALTYTSTTMVDGEPSRTVSMIGRGRERSYTFSTLMDAPGIPTKVGRGVRSNNVAGAGLYSISLRAPGGPVLWNVAIVGTPEVTLPAVPSGLVDPVRGPLVVEVTAADLGGATLLDAKFRELTSKIRASASARARLSF